MGLKMKYSGTKIVKLIQVIAVGGVIALTGACDGSGDDASAASAQTQSFDLQAHRGGLGLNVESSIASFSQARNWA